MRFAAAILRPWIIYSRKICSLQPSTAKLTGKKEELEALKPSAAVKTVSIRNEDLKVRVFGNAAVVTALTKMQFVIKEKDVYTDCRYTAVFVKQEGRWQLAALQSARAPQPIAN